MLNDAGTIYTKNARIRARHAASTTSANLTQMEHAGGAIRRQGRHAVPRAARRPRGNTGACRPASTWSTTTAESRTWSIRPSTASCKTRDDGAKVPNKFEAPKTRLMALIIDGILNRKLPWELVLIGVLIAVVLELAGVPSLPFAVGVYLPLQTSMPIFVGGMVRWIVDKIKGTASRRAETSPGVLLSSGYIAGGSIAGVLIAFFGIRPDESTQGPESGRRSDAAWNKSHLGTGPCWHPRHLVALGTFAILARRARSGWARQQARESARGSPRNNPEARTYRFKRTRRLNIQSQEIGSSWI